MIQVENLVYTYPKGTSPTVKGISFRVQAGEIFGFLGPSGAGKSTTLNVLIRLLKGFEGEVVVLDRKLRDWQDDYYEHVGVGFELPNHYRKLTAVENLQFFASFYRKKTQDPVHLLELVGLREHAGKKVEDFSKGMKMRLNFVRALLHDPEIVFLDEPTSGLDPVNARAMKNIIMDLKRRGKTIVITTHNMHDAEELCDRVAFIVGGEIKLIETPKTLKLQAGQRTVRVEFERDGLTTREFPLDGLGANAEFLRILQDERVQAIHSQEATLEKVFVDATGAHLA
ncbi:ABC transporter ATP-binding protein [Sorangium sp. So ce426]|uniref:ABC transporter ATP-binding protein n=1 Tax=unclassified Sorangium TaxID=2621164 RepID=UPI003F5B95E1